MMNPIDVLIGVFIGAMLRGAFMEWLAKRRLRCEVCGSETTPEGRGACGVLGSDDDPFKNWGRKR